MARADGVTTMDFSKLDGLVPAVVQDDATGEVLMVGFMNQEALDRTRRDRLRDVLQPHAATLWTKGETSGNRLQVVGCSWTATTTRCC